MLVHSQEKKSKTRLVSQVIVLSSQQCQKTKEQLELGSVEEKSTIETKRIQTKNGRVEFRERVYGSTNGRTSGRKS